MVYNAIKILLLMILAINSYCKGQISLNDIDLNKVQETTVQEFFSHMMSNMYPEKVARRNYYIFGTIKGYVLYGKTEPKLFTSNIAEIYKIDSTVLVQKFPNYAKLSGEILLNILKEDIKKVENLGSVNEIIIDDVFFSLNLDIIVEVTYHTIKNNKNKTVVYNFTCTDFSIKK